MSLVANLVLACALCTASASLCQEDRWFPIHEAGLGLGVSRSTEKNVFNIPPGFDHDVGTAFSMNAMYYYNFNAKLALGAHAFGYFKTLGDVTFVGPDLLITDDIRIETINVGTRIRYTLGRAAVQPYVLGGASLATGNIRGDFVGRLDHFGLSALAGVGINFINLRSWGFSLEGVASFGFASWERKPFIDSSGDEFDPSMFAAFLNCFYRWG